MNKVIVSFGLASLVVVQPNAYAAPQISGLLRRCILTLEGAGFGPFNLENRVPMPKPNYIVSKDRREWTLHIPSDPVETGVPFRYAYSDGLQRFESDFIRADRGVMDDDGIRFNSKYTEFKSQVGEDGSLTITIKNLHDPKGMYPILFKVLDKAIERRLSRWEKDIRKSFYESPRPLGFQSGFSSREEALDAVQSSTTDWKIPLNGKSTYSFGGAWHPDWPRLNHMTEALPGGGYSHWTRLVVDMRLLKTSGLNYGELIEGLNDILNAKGNDPGMYFRSPAGNAWLVWTSYEGGTLFSSDQSYFAVFKSEETAKQFAEVVRQKLQSEKSAE